MDIFWHGLLIGCIFTAAVGGSEDAMQRRTIPSFDEYRDAETAEDHEHHRIIIVVPKEVPHHVNHVHTYKLSGKGIPLIHSGKVVHDHKHNGKVAHEHGHVGKSVHSHKHGGAYGHQHKHAGYAGHRHFGKVQLVATGGKGGAAPHHVRLLQQQQLRSPVDHRPLLRTAAHQLHLRQQQQQHQHQHQQAGVDYRVQQHGSGGGTSGVLGPGPGGRGPVSGQVQFVPSSRPQGLGSFIPAEIQRYVQHDGRLHGQRLHHQDHVRVDDGDDGGDGPRAGYNVIHLRVPDQAGPEVIKHVDIDLTNNVAQLQNGDKAQLPAVTANYKSVTQYNKVIGHGRAVVPSAEEEFDGNIADDEDGGELLLEDVGYRFGEGYRLAMDSGVGGGGDFSAAQEQDEEEVDEFNQEASAPLEFDDPSDDGQAYSQTYTMQY